MTSIFPAYSAVGLGNRPLTPQRVDARPQPAPGQPRFAGDAFLIRQQLLAAKKAAENRAAEAAQQSKEAEIKAVCDTVVWQQGDKTINVGEMVAFLCRKRPDEKYPGYGSLETIAKDFPGMDMDKLKQGFEKLYQDYFYLGKSETNQVYWLLTLGEEMLQKLYPNLPLPPKAERHSTPSQYQPD